MLIDIICSSFVSLPFTSSLPLCFRTYVRNRSVQCCTDVNSVNASCCCSSEEFKKDVTFSEFVRYVLWRRDHKGRVNVHWRPQYDQCRPCHIKYDYIGHYETMHDDAKDVLRHIAAGADVQFPLGDFDSRVPNSNKYLDLFENVSISDIRRILDLYKNDYKVFNYKIPDIIRRRLEGENILSSSTVTQQLRV